MFLVGYTDYLPHLESPSSLQWRNSKYLDSSSVFNLVQSLPTRLHEISHLHPAPPWHHLYKEPVLDLSLKYIIFSSDGTCLHLRVNLLPPNLNGQELCHPQYSLLDPDPCRSWEYKDTFTVWRAPRIHKLLKRNLKSLMAQQALVPSKYSSPAKKPFFEFPVTSGFTKLLLIVLGMWEAIQQALWYKHICYMFFSTSKYFTKNINYLQEGLPHGKRKK